MMKYVLMLIMLSLGGLVSAADGYPGNEPNWNDRYSVSCEMTKNGTEQVNYRFLHGALDYPQAGSLMFFIQQGQASWYEAIRDQADSSGLDMRLFPLSDSVLKDLIEIERVMSGKFDQ